MRSHVLAVATTAVILACGAIPSSAQMIQQPDQPQTHQRDQGTPGTGGGGIMYGGMMGHGTMGRGMMRHGMMGHRGMMGPLAIRIIFALIDADGDGTISLQEWQAAHEKIFKAMDPDKDGTVSLEEMMNFMRGGRMPTQQGR
jgi:EF-hand domain pair